MAQRPASGLPTRRSAMRQPTKPGNSIAGKADTPEPALKSLYGSASRVQRIPSEQPSVSLKRKDKEFEPPIGDDTSIHVVVRCRGRNDREVKENSGVVVATEGVRGATVELSMGPNAVSNKTYSFDKVFSPAADQTIVFEDVVAPILNEMLAGYNCTIFAYGQTGTGKTYTMSGDMTDTLGILSDNAGIIPRVLYSVFHKLEDTESTVKCSFIELYNEELRDLLSPEENAKLKIYDNETKKGQSSTTLVQGMEETYIDSAHAGIKLLQKGSHRRQVAATKCNDLSSRSHTVFAITVFTKRTTESGEDYISSGKLNLVDLAGSENIQRSGAENKRATEAGLINKSLLTLGRVINALVDKSSHIPYRESKLTRLLQDSLGGRTKTCIIATISPSRSNLDETISTLDYAFRAKNIRNKPQINSTMSKKTLLREFTTEIEKLKSDLIATRHRNGVYMTTEAYEEMTVESESRRIVNEEQRAKIESMEHSLRNKVTELLTLTSNFNNLKKENEEARAALSTTNDILQQTEIVLNNTRESLEEEEVLRKAHEQTEQHLSDIGAGLLSTLGTAVNDVESLHAKISRKSKMHDRNRKIWEISTTEVVDVARDVDAKVAQFQEHQSQLLEEVSGRLHACLDRELSAFGEDQALLQGLVTSLGEAESESKKEAFAAHSEMSDILGEMMTLRESVKKRVGESMKGLSVAAARISKDVIAEFIQFHDQLNDSYTTLGDDFKSILGAMQAHARNQTEEIKNLRAQLQEANRQSMEANRTACSDLVNILEEEDAQAETERDLLLSQIRALMDESRRRQQSYLKGKVDIIQANLTSSYQQLDDATVQYDRHVHSWVDKEEQFSTRLNSSQVQFAKRIEDDWKMVETRAASIHEMTDSMHDKAVQIVDVQLNDLENQMKALDDFVTKATAQERRYKESQVQSVEKLAGNVRQGSSTLSERLKDAGDRLQAMQHGVLAQAKVAQDLIQPLSAQVREPLSALCLHIQNRQLFEYTATGTTPKKRKYLYPTTLPRTEPHESLIAGMRNKRPLAALPFNRQDEPTPTGNSAEIFPAESPSCNDSEDAVEAACSSSTRSPVDLLLREVDGNIVANLTAYDAESETSLGKRPSSVMDASDKMEGIGPPASKRRQSASAKTESKLPQKMVTRRMAGILEMDESAPKSSRIGPRTRSAV